MSYLPILTLTRPLTESPDDLYTVNAYDMEHFGVLIIAVRMSDKSEISMNITEGQVLIVNLRPSHDVDLSTLLIEDSRWTRQIY
jgi:hypothetical protein